MTSPGKSNMTDAIRPLIAGNWKMNGLKASSAEFEAMLAAAPGLAAKADLLVCRQATLIAAFAEKARGSKTLAVGGRIVTSELGRPYRRYFGRMLTGCRRLLHVIVGHSERRANHRETERAVRAKAEAVRRPALPPSSASAKPRPQRESRANPRRDDAGNSTRRCRIRRRAADIVIAYEPIWAIGTGLTPTTKMSQCMLLSGRTNRRLPARELKCASFTAAR